MSAPADLDHLVLATPDLAATVANFAARMGISPAPGGSHTGLGTANALVGLGPSSYLEIVGPDPRQPEPPAPRPFGIDDLERATLVTWAVHPADIDATIKRARRSRDDPGDAQPMSRRTPDGDELRWRLTPFRGPVPFLIDWGDTPHPATRGLPVVELVSLTLRDPQPAVVQAALDALQVPAVVGAGSTVELVAVLRTPNGVVSL